MTRVARYMILPIALLLQCPAGAAPRDARPDELSQSPYDQILLQERKYTAGVLHGDIRLLDSVFADSFVDTSSAGVDRKSVV